MKGFRIYWSDKEDKNIMEFDGGNTKVSLKLNNSELKKVKLKIEEHFRTREFFEESNDIKKGDEVKIRGTNVVDEVVELLDKTTVKLRNEGRIKRAYLKKR